MSDKLPSPTKCALGYGLILLTALYPLHPAWGTALISADRSTQITQKNNIPIINIATPNNAGVSHNKYHDFNIDKQGVVLNNATNKIASQLAGQINANSQLKGKAADLIINEVTSNRVSSLQGKLEVAGQKAGVFVANPNGITCNGCGFINSPAVTLTTGKPIFDPQGVMAALEVKRGSVIIDSNGMDTQASDYTEIISRSTVLNGEINAQHLSLIQGANKVDFKNGTITQINGDGTKPTIAIDTKSLGGMYANQIRLVSNEAGVGVNLANIHSKQKDIVLTVDGKITFNGNIQAKTNLNISSKDIQINRNKRLQAEKDITFASDSLNNQGQIIAQKDMRLFSDKLINSGDNALIQAKDNLWIQKNAQGDLSHLVENRAATIKTEKGDLIIRTNQLENKNPLTIIEEKTLPNEGVLLVNEWGLMSANNPRWLNIAFAELGLSVDDDASKIPRKWFGITQIPYDLDERDMHFHVQKGIFKLENASQPSSILGGNNVFINANFINNSQSDISAENDLIITGGELNNPSLSTGQYHFFDYYQRNGEYREFGGREVPVRVYQRHNLWIDNEIYSGNISAKNNLVVDVLSNFNFDISRGETRDDFKLHEIITTKFSPTTISANNIIFDVNNIIGSGNIEAKNDFTIIANKNFTLTQSVLQAGKDLTLDVVELIKGNIVSLIGENVSLFSKNSSIIFDIPHFSLYDETSAKYSSRIGASGVNTLVAGKDITLNNVSISDADSLRVSAGNNISMNNDKDYMESLFFHPYPYIDSINSNNYSFRPKVSVASYDNLLSFVNNSDITLAANNDIILQGVSFFSKYSTNLTAGRDIKLFSEDNLSLYEIPDSSVNNIVKRIDFYTGKDLLLSSGRDINLNGINLISKERLTLLAGRNIDLNPRAFSWHTNTDSEIINQLNIDTLVRGDKGLTLAANDSITSKGAGFRSQSDILLTSGGDIRLESVKTPFRRQDGNVLKEYHNQSITDIWTRANLTILSEGSILFQATKMVAKGAMEIAAKGGFLYAQAVEEVYSQSGKDRSCKRFLGFKSCNLFGSKTKNWTKSQVKNRVTEFTAEEDINLWARDDITLEASKISTRKNAKITSQQGNVNFRAVKNRNFEQVIGKSSGFFITHNDTGYIEDIWALPSLYIGGELTIDPSYRISADIKANNRKSIDNILTSLSNTQGMEWLAQLQKNDKVRWDLVYDAYDDWDHETKQLNPVVSAVIAIAVAAASYGTGLAASAGSTAVTATGTTGVSAAVVSGMGSAGFAGLTSQAAVALVENEGNIFNAFIALGNSDTVKSLASQMIIGGALNGLDVYMGWKADPTLSTPLDAVDPTQFQIPSLTNYQWNDVARRIAAQSAIRTTVDRAINGGSFVDNFKAALTSSIANQLHADGAKYIGDSAEYLGQGGKVLSHATVAGIAAEISGGNVKGAMVGSLAAELAAVSFGDNIVKASEWGRISEAQAQIVRAFGGIAGGVFTGKPGGVYSGAEAAETTFRYNYLSHHQDELKNKELAAETNDFKKTLIAMKWLYIDIDQDVAFGAGMIGGIPAGLYETIDGLAHLASNPKETYAALRAVLMSDDTLGIMTDAVRQSYLSRINKMEAEYQKAGTEGAFKAGIEGGKLIFDIAGTFAGGAGVAKGGVNLVEKVSTKIISKQLVNGKPIIFANGFYSVDGMKISQSYYDRLWQQGRPAPFIQASEVLKNKPKIIPDPQGAPGYYKYEAVGLEMIYNPTTGQIGHIQPIKIRKP